MPPTIEKRDPDPPVHDLLTLTAGGTVAQLVHRGEVSVLRVTRLGKLILTS